MTGYGSPIYALIPDEMLELFLGNSSTAMWLLPAALCMGKGKFVLNGVPCMCKRPMNMEDNTLHRIKAKNAVLATGGYGRTYFSYTLPNTCTGDGNTMAIRDRLDNQDV